MPPTVLHLSTYAANGGAARAATALHLAMLREHVPSTFRTASGFRFRAASLADRQLWRLQSSDNRSWRSPARFGSLTAREINATAVDVVNLHWVTDGFLSIEEIGRITKPVVWSLYDMWPFAGTEHYGADTPDARWRTGYTAENRAPGDRGLDLDRDTWERKCRSWNPMQIVPASTWLTDAARSSALMHDWPITRVPHVVDDSAFTPISRDQARGQLGLPGDEPIIVFLASAGIADQRKGFDLLESALPAVRTAIPDVRVLVVGPTSPETTRDVGGPVTWLGTVAGDEALTAAYCAGDVVAVPSREDNMPLTAMEAQTCGRAVVGFRIGGLPDIVEHHRTGYLATALDVDDLALGLIQAIEDSRGQGSWATAARERALATWSPAAVVPQYLALYGAAMSR